MKRNDLYKFIKDNGLQEEIKEKFGKNYTNVSTKDLESICGNSKKEEEEEEKTNDLRPAVKALLKFLYDVDKTLFDDVC